MQPESYQTLIGVVVVIVFLFLAGLFIFALVTYSNNRKKKFFLEKQTMELIHTEEMLKLQLEIQEQTFNHVSQEIHDNVGQVLSLAKVQLSILDQGKAYNETVIRELKDTLSKAMSDLRDMAKSMNSDRILDFSLVELITQELKRVERSCAISTSVNSSGIERKHSPKIKITVFRIAQEALQNILKHAAADNILVNIQYNENEFHCSISDNGSGFDNATAKSAASLGLVNMKSRAKSVGGDCTIDSQPGKGTRITITTPYE